MNANQMTRSSTLGARLRAERERQGLSQGQVAAGLGVSQPSYSSWERGESRPDAEHLGGIARFLRQSIDDIWRSVWHERPTPDGWADSPLAFRLRSMDQRITELETMMSCITDLIVGGAGETVAEDAGSADSSRSTDALRAHETIRSRADTYRQQLSDTPDFAEVCPECPSLADLSGQQISYWKAEYTKRGGAHASWR